VKITGGSHCGAVRFRFESKHQVELLDCNCSICSATGFLHLIISHDRFTLHTGAEALESYSFGSRAAEHLFCKTCGVKSFYQPRSHPNAWSVNFNCLDEGHGLEQHVRAFDGRNWAAARDALN
jgi:hypothetical protein